MTSPRTCERMNETTNIKETTRYMIATADHRSEYPTSPFTHNVSIKTKHSKNTKLFDWNTNNVYYIRSNFICVFIAVFEEKIISCPGNYDSISNNLEKKNV